MVTNDLMRLRLIFSQRTVEVLGFAAGFLTPALILWTGFRLIVVDHDPSGLIFILLLTPLYLLAAAGVSEWRWSKRRGRRGPVGRWLRRCLDAWVLLGLLAVALIAAPGLVLFGLQDAYQGLGSGDGWRVVAGLIWIPPTIAGGAAAGALALRAWENRLAFRRSRRRSGFIIPELYDILTGKLDADEQRADDLLATHSTNLDVRSGEQDQVLRDVLDLLEWQKDDPDRCDVGLSGRTHPAYAWRVVDNVRRTRA